MTRRFSAVATCLSHAIRSILITKMAPPCARTVMAALPYVLLMVLLCGVFGEDVGHDFDFDGLPGVQFDLKFEIGPGQSQCFFQKIKKSATLVASFEVLRGADRNADMVISKPDGQVLESHLWTSEGTTEKEIDEDGIYKFCIDNQFSRFSTKLVYFYLITYVMEEWENYTKELEDFQIHVTNFTESIGTVSRSLHVIRKHLSNSRKHVNTDWYIIKTNNWYIQNWSILMCVVIVMTSGLQVFFVRRLFRVNTVTPTQKPRA